MSRARLASATLFSLAGVALLATAACSARPARDAAPAPRFILGVQTHFSHNWPAALVQQATAVSAGSLRDGMPWAAAERRPAIYDLTGPAAAPLQAFCARGGDVLLTIDPRNPLYDGGSTARTPAAMAAFAAYVAAVLDRFGPCIGGIEIGNEINNRRNLTYPAGVDDAAAYVALVRTVRVAIHARHPHMAILGGSTNVIGTGFLERLFKAGLLDAADGIAVHPYRSHAENVDREIDHLVSTMRRYGQPLPVWATEFSDNYPDAALAAPQLIKMVTLLGASGVARAYWYALIDQRWFRNMGLFDAERHAKPAADAFRMMTQRLLPAGRPVRVDTGDANVMLFRFGADKYVAWGASGRLRFGGRPVIRDARGRLSSDQTLVSIGDAPLIVEGATGFTLDRGAVLADSLLGYGAKPWAYLARTTDGTDHAIVLFDWDWTSYHSARAWRPMWLGDYTGAPSGDAAHAVRPLLRYTAPAALAVRVSTCITKGAGGDGVDVTVAHNGKPIKSAIVTDRMVVSGLDVDLKAGDTIDLAVGPNRMPGNDAFAYRVQVSRRNGAGDAPCM